MSWKKGRKEGKIPRIHRPNSRANCSCANLFMPVARSESNALFVGRLILVVAAAKTRRRLACAAFCGVVAGRLSFRGIEDCAGAAGWPSRVGVDDGVIVVKGTVDEAWMDVVLAVRAVSLDFRAQILCIVVGDVCCRESDGTRTRNLCEYYVVMGFVPGRKWDVVTERVRRREK